MTEVSAADLKPFPSRYESSRGLFDLLVGEDDALPLLEASWAGQSVTLQNMLLESSWTSIALESPHCIYHEERPRRDKSDVRGVLAMKFSNLQRAILKATEAGHAASVSTLLDFASHHSVATIGRFTIRKAIENGHAAVLDVLATADPTAITFNFGHDTQPLDIAIAEHQPEVIEVLLRLGAGRETRRKPTKSYQFTRLSRATRDPMGARMTALLLQYGVPVTGSGALHFAASRGALDIMRLLIQHGADVNERLSEDSVPYPDKARCTNWTPMHLAASSGQMDAMKLLESEGAQPDIKDNDGKAPWQLLEEQQKK